MSNKLERILGNSPRNALNIGHGSYVLIDRLVAILESGSLPAKRLRDAATEANCLIDATAGRKTRALLVTDTKHIVLSALAPQTLHERLSGTREPINPGYFELESGELVS